MDFIKENICLAIRILVQKRCQFIKQHARLEVLCIHLVIQIKIKDRGRLVKFSYNQIPYLGDEYRFSTTSHASDDFHDICTDKRPNFIYRFFANYHLTYLLVANIIPKL